MKSGLRTLLSALVAACIGFCQLPPSQQLSPADQKEFAQELNRLKQLLNTTNEQCALEAEIARTYAAGGQYREAIDWLQKLVNRNLGFDLSRDQLFRPLAGTEEFRRISSVMQAQTLPITNSSLYATLPESYLFPENMAYDAKAGTFLLGSTAKDVIVRCYPNEPCQPFAASGPGAGYALGMKVDRRSGTLWATRNTNEGASLRSYNLVSRQLIREFSLSGFHLFNDVAVSSHGDVFVTDTKAGAVYQTRLNERTLQPVARQHVFPAANGITLSKDESKLFVSDFADGISVVDLSSEFVTAMLHPANICLGYIDGLYAVDDRLIAFQNGPMSPRIVSFSLNQEGHRITAMTILERRNAAFDGITTGVVADHRLFYVANPQIDKKDLPHDKLQPLKIFSLNLLP